MHHLLAFIFVVTFFLFPANASADTATKPTYTDAEYLNALGWALSVQGQVKQLGLTDAELEELIRGFKDSMKDGSIPECISSPGFFEFLQAKAKLYTETHDKELEAMISENTKIQDAFLSNLEKQVNVHKQESGLFYEVLKEGSGAYPTLESWVLVHYTGQLTNGKVFDSSVPRGEPVRFDLNAVIPGFQEGLQLINKGGKIRLYIPAALAYGNIEQPGIPAGSLLIFDVELLDFGASK